MEHDTQDKQQNKTGNNKINTMTHHFMESSIILFSTPLLWYNFNQRSCLIPKIPNLCLSFPLF